MKSLPAFFARPFAAMKNHFAATALFAALMLSVVAAPVPASADESHHESGTAHIAKNPEADAAEAEGTQTVTVYHYEMVYYDDPTFEDSGVPELSGMRLIGTSTVEGLKPGDVVQAWDQVGTHPGFAFYDGWPRELTVSEDPSENVIQLNYFRQASDVTVNYYEATLLDAGAALPLRGDAMVESVGELSVGFTKLGSEVLPGELFASVLTGDELAEAAASKRPGAPEGDGADDEVDDGEELAYVGSYPEDVFVGMDASKNEINLVYTRPVAGPDHIEMESDAVVLPDAVETDPGEVILPDSVPGASAPGQGGGSENAGDDGSASGDGAQGAGSEPAQSGAEGAGQAGNASEDGGADTTEGADASEGGATQVVEGDPTATKGHAEAEAAAENGVLTLPQTGDEWGLTFALVLLASGLAAVAAAAALRKIRR